MEMADLEDIAVGFVKELEGLFGIGKDKKDLRFGVESVPKGYAVAWYWIEKLRGEMILSQPEEKGPVVIEFAQHIKSPAADQFHPCELPSAAEIYQKVELFVENKCGRHVKADSMYMTYHLQHKG